MAKPEYEKISLNKNVKEIKDRFSVDCRTDIHSETVKRIINISTAVDNDNESLENKTINYNGRVCLILCYEDNEGNLKKTECNCNYNGSIQNDELEGYNKVDIDVCVEKVEANLSGIKLSFTLYLLANATVSGCYEADALTGGENIIGNPVEINTLKTLGVKQTNYPINEEFDIDFEVKEVLSHKAQAVVTSCQCGVGCIIVDGEVYVSMILQKNAEGVQVEKIEKSFPFRAEVECEEAMPVCNCNALVSVKSFKLDISVTAGENKAESEISVVLAIKGEAFENQTISVFNDAFCLGENVSINRVTFINATMCEVRSEYSKINGKCNIEEIEPDAKLLFVSNEKAEITEVTGNENGLEITGVCVASGWFIGDNNRLFSRKTETPFTTQLNMPNKCGSEYKVVCIAHKGEAKIVSGSELDICFDLSFTIYPIDKSEICLIKEIDFTGEKKEEKCAISVYIARENESLWELSKRLNVCPDNLVNSNKELQFPLSGEERIIVYRHS